MSVASSYKTIITPTCLRVTVAMYGQRERTWLMGRGDGVIRRRAPSGSFVELRLQMYLARNRSLHPSLPVHCRDVLSDLRFVTAPGLRFIQLAHSPLYAWLVDQRLLTPWISLRLSQHAASHPLLYWPFMTLRQRASDERRCWDTQGILTSRSHMSVLMRPTEESGQCARRTALGASGRVYHRRSCHRRTRGGYQEEKKNTDAWLAGR